MSSLLTPIADSQSEEKSTVLRYFRLSVALTFCVVTAACVGEAEYYSLVPSDATADVGGGASGVSDEDVREDNESDSCNNDCQFAYDGGCDDGRPGASTALCLPGTDCADCGPFRNENPAPDPSSDAGMGGNPTDSGSTCADDCSDSERRCLSDVEEELCGYFDGDPCLDWGARRSCDSGEMCRDREGCVPAGGQADAGMGPDVGSDCTNECSTSSARRCSGARAFEVCGDYDSDSCLEWGAPSSCTGSELCEGDGRCATPAECRTASECPGRTTESGICASSSSNACSSTGSRSVTTYVPTCDSGRCGLDSNTATQSCTEVRDGDNCGSGRICSGGSCVVPPECSRDSECPGRSSTSGSCDYSTVCSTSGTQSVTTYTSRCRSGRCDLDPSSSSRSCGSRSTEGVSCGSNRICRSGACIDDCRSTGSRSCRSGDIYTIDTCGNSTRVTQCTGGRTCQASGSGASCVCTSTSERRCIGNAIYSVDSCGSTSLAESCNGGRQCTASSGGRASCDCVDTSETTCSGNTIYRVNSCGSRGSFVRTCSSSQICDRGSCIAACSASRDWSPSSVSETDELGRQYNRNINEPLTMSIINNSSGTVQMVVEKLSGTYEENVHLIMRGNSTSSSGYIELLRGAYITEGDTELRVTIPSSFYRSLGEGDFIRMSGQVVSPSRCASSWGLGCVPPSTSCGTCWNFNPPSLNRTCR
jgi:hypothetical protein